MKRAWSGDEIAHGSAGTGGGPRATPRLAQACEAVEQRSRGACHEILFWPQLARNLGARVQGTYFARRLIDNYPGVTAYQYFLLATLRRIDHRTDHCHRGESRGLR